MAMSGLVSNRNFSPFVGSGNEYQTQNLPFKKGGCFVVSVARCSGRISNNLTLRCSDGLFSNSTATLDGKFPKQWHKFCDRRKNICVMHLQSIFSVCKKTNVSTMYQFFLSSDHLRNGQIPSKPPKGLNLSKRKHLRSELSQKRKESLLSTDGSSEAFLVEGNVQEVSPGWEQFPKRWVIALLCFAAFLLCNMDRVNMSIAILPMSKEFNWNSATVGLIQSSFFWVYLFTQILGGIWADKIGGKLVLGFGAVWWSIATVLTPIAARIGLPCLLTMRAFIGIGEGVAMPAMNNLLSKWIPLSERSRSLALVYSGMYLGSVMGWTFYPILIHKFGWPSVFFSFGSLGSIWFALLIKKVFHFKSSLDPVVGDAILRNSHFDEDNYSSPKEDPELSAEEKRLIMGGNISRESVSVLPWKLFLSKAPVWVLIISHFCHNWGTFILLTWMPTYYNQVLKFNLAESGLLCVLPWLTMAAFANIGGWIADTLVTKGLSITSVRKIMQSIGFLGRAFFLTQLSHVKTLAMAVLCMACSQGSDAFSQSGLIPITRTLGHVMLHECYLQ